MGQNGSDEPGSGDTKDLRNAVQSRGYRPARADVEALFARLAAADRDDAEVAERALARLGRSAADEASARFPAARAPERGRLCKLIGRIASEKDDAALRAFLLQALTDEDTKSRRNAIIALGKIGGPGVAEALRGRWEAEPTVELRRSLAAAYGKIGGAAALPILRAVETGDKELRRIVDEAVLKLERTLGRVQAGGIASERASASPIVVLLHCREGLQHLVADELADLSPKPIGVDQVSVSLTGAMSRLWASRTMLRFGFPLPVPAGKEIAEAVTAALTSDEAARIFAAWTDGTIRYRMEWAEGGHRRGMTFQVAAAVAKKRPAMVNDPTATLWEAVITETPKIAVELWPRGLDDPRFAYRRAHVPASSHPTLAAALARVGGVRPDDVVWDPFVGAGTELIERAHLGPYARLYGTDLDEPALARARENLLAAKITNAQIELGDAREYRPKRRPTLIITNPPMGRRVLNRSLIGALYDAFLDNVATNVLAPDGRLVWISPRAAATVERAERLGLRMTFRQRVDMGGFWGEIQAFDFRGRPGVSKPRVRR
jgi:23S rRNA G2445 N2-methylase RlmL